MKYKLSKERCHKGIFSFSEMEIFLVKKGPYMLYNYKNGHQKFSNFRRQNGNFFIKRLFSHSKILVCKICFSPSQSRRQVSAYVCNHMPVLMFYIISCRRRLLNHTGHCVRLLHEQLGLIQAELKGKLHID